MFDDYEVDAADASSLKQDQRNHPRTSHASLRDLARTTYCTPTCRRTRKEVKAWMKDPYRRAPNKAQFWPQSCRSEHDQLEAATQWLLQHSHELPGELESEDGLMLHVNNHIEKTWESGDVAKLEDTDGDGTFSKYERHGLEYPGELTCYQNLESIARSEYPAEPTSQVARSYALKVRAERFREVFSAKQARLRWRGMEEYNAVEKANEKLREGVARKPVKSIAKPLPPIDGLREKFDVVDGKLVNKRLKREVKGKQVKVFGEVHWTARVAYAVANGVDPEDKVVSGGVATHYRKAIGTAYERGDGNWDSIVSVGTDRVTVGEYRSEAQAAAAARLYIRSLDMGL